MNKKESLIKFLEGISVFKTGHFKLNSGQHTKIYVDKSLLITYPRKLSWISSQIISGCLGLEPQVIISPAPIASILGFEAAKHFVESTIIASNVRFVLAEKKTQGIFDFRNSFNLIIRGKNILIIEDVITSGKSVKNLIHTTEEKLHGKVIGVGCLINRGGVTREDLSVPFLYSLIDMPIETWSEENCPLCKEGIPLDHKFGHPSR